MDDLNELVENQRKIVSIYNNEKERYSKEYKFFYSDLYEARDKENWYNTNSIICQVFTLPQHPNIVRILFKSYDDFMMYVDVQAAQDDEVENLFTFCVSFCKMMPYMVSVSYLVSLGFKQF